MIYWTIYAALVRVVRRLRRARLRVLAGRLVVTRAPKAFVSHPEPGSIGSFARGQQMIAGNFQFSGAVIEAPGRPIWSVATDPAVVAEIQGCAWIDDIAATGTAAGQRTLQSWVAEWIRLYGNGAGPGWTPDLTGQRLIHWISNAITIMRGQDRRATDAFLRSLARQASFLQHTWSSAPAGLPRIQALTGLIYVSLALEGMDGLLKPSLRRLGKECAARIGPDGSIGSRNPEELLEIFKLLVWAKKVLTEADQTPDPRHADALDRIAPTLRILRLGNGALVRFHGGGRGSEGVLDQALAESGVRARAMMETRMGYARLASGRTIAVLDGAAPATGRASPRAHASTLAFEMSSGRHPLIVNCGPGRFFGSEWARRSRMSASHSTLVLGRTSSSTVWTSGFAGDTFGERLSHAPGRVTIDRANDVSGVWVLGSHDGYVGRTGLTHDRRLFLSPNGREFRGEDTLYLRQNRHRSTLLTAESAAGEPLTFELFFHLHPDVAASLDMSGHAVSLKLKSEEIWVFRQSGGTTTLEDGGFLDQQRLRPRATRVIAVRGTVTDARGQITWALTRAQEGIRYTSGTAAAEDLEPLV